MSAPVWTWPSGLWSLWDMQDFPATTLIGDLGHLQECEHRLVRAMETLGPTASLPDGEGRILMALLVLTSKECTVLDLKDSCHRIGDLSLRLSGATVPPMPRNLQLVHAELSALRQHLWRDLHAYKYLYLDKSEQDFYAQQQLFGPQVFGAFRGAREDVAEAGNCYALGRHTATVFHCMRIVEHGLRALAAEVGVSFGTDQWAVVIKNIEAKLKGFADNGIPGITDKATKDAKLQFLSEAAAEFRYFKDAWRNYVSHGKDGYDPLQAQSILNHTGEFMRGLSRELREVP